MTKMTGMLMGRGHAPREVAADLLAGLWLSGLVVGLLHLPAF